MALWMKVLNAVFIILGIAVKWLFFTNKNLGNSYKEGIIEGLTTRNKLTKIDSSFSNQLNVEWLLIRNTFTYLF
jgi:hypothetical protein